MSNSGHQCKLGYYSIVLQEKKEIIFANQKQSVPLRMKDCVEMTMFRCLICLIYPGVQIFHRNCSILLYELVVLPGLKTCNTGAPTVSSKKIL